MLSYPYVKVQINYARVLFSRPVMASQRATAFVSSLESWPCSPTFRHLQKGEQPVLNGCIISSAGRDGALCLSNGGILSTEKCSPKNTFVTLISDETLA